MPLVSVVMASYNYERFIPETIEAILNQSFKDLELIIVDDASKDNSVEIIKAYQEKDGRVRPVFHNENKGIARTFNDGLDNACGKFAAITGCDDVWFEHKLQKQFDVLKENEDFVVYSDCITIDAQGNTIKNTNPEKDKNKKRSGHLFRELLGGNFVCGSSVIFKKDNLGPIRFDERYRYVNDYKFALELALKYEFYFIEEALVKYRIHGGNVTLHDKAGWLEDFAKFGKELLEKHENEFPKKAKARFLFKIASDEHRRGNIRQARKYILGAIANYPFRMKYLKFLFSSLGKNNFTACGKSE